LIQTWTLQALRSPSSSEAFGKYSALFSRRAWNQALSIVYATRSYEAGLDGARTLAMLTERFKVQLGPDRYEQNLIRIALLELTCLDRLDRPAEYLEAWQAWRIRRLPLRYGLSRRGNPRIIPFVLEETNTALAVHFLYLTWARKKIVERKVGAERFRRHARQEDLTNEEFRIRLSQGMQAS
jgi:hypothetical protein